jgi:hypothetical protein
MASEGFHESPQELTAQTRDMHRAIRSLIEELDAVDWYQQRVDATTDDAAVHLYCVETIAAQLLTPEALCLILPG